MLTENRFEILLREVHRAMWENKDHALAYQLLYGMAREIAADGCARVKEVDAAISTKLTTLTRDAINVRFTQKDVDFGVVTNGNIEVLTGAKYDDIAKCKRIVVEGRLVEADQEVAGVKPKAADSQAVAPALEISKDAAKVCFQVKHDVAAGCYPVALTDHDISTLFNQPHGEISGIKRIKYRVVVEEMEPFSPE